ncbi:hydroxylamine reductase [Mycoplasmatota bacterium zrk1]
MKMFCYQCQETAKNTGCEVIGVCGKTPELATKMDALKYVLKGLSYVANEAEKEGAELKRIDVFIMECLFKMITNANFNEEHFERVIKEGIQYRENLKKGIKFDSDLDAVNWTDTSVDEIINKGKKNGVLSTPDEDVRSAKETVLYGLMGMAAYHSHANRLGKHSEAASKFTRRALASMLEDHDLGFYVEMIDETGKFGVEVMSILDEANTTAYGEPEISKVKIGVGKRPGILVSGHDLRDIDQLLRQSVDAGIDIYTHSEMLPAHYYPLLKKYDHLYGNYGNAWHDQIESFETFNGPVLFTTNCIVPPKKFSTYNERMYITGSTGYPGWKYIEADKDGEKDFSEIIEHAKHCKPPKKIESGEIVGGFAHGQVLKLADKIVEAINSGAIKKFVVMAGCDGRFKSRTYYTDFAKALPKDTVILTAGCAKYRYNKLKLGDIDGIPRVLDAGQCNDSYSLVVTALELAKVFNCDINDLPIVYNIAWYEQKAVIVLLALLHLKVHHITVGPTIPGFLSKNVANFLIENYNLGAISTVERDIERLILNH